MQRLVSRGRGLVSPGWAGRPRAHGYDGRNMLCKPDGLRCRGVNRISGEAEYRRSREWHGMPRKKRTGVRFVPGESATVSRQIDSLSPEGRERNAGRMAVEPRARLYHGESATVSRQIDSLYPEGRERNAGRMAVEPRARFLPRGKVLRFHGKSVHFPPRRQMYACRTSMTENTVSCFVFHVAELELFMKTAGAAVNC